MKNLRLIALGCFAIAFACYAASWTHGAGVFVFFGSLFELAGWKYLFSKRTGEDRVE